MVLPDADFLLTIGGFLLSGAFLLTVDNLVCLLTAGAFRLTILSSLLTIGAFLLTVGRCV